MLLGPSPHELSEFECWHLLGAGGIGRLAITVGALPRIVPVRFALNGDAVVLCLGDQEQLAASVDNTVVALAVDSLSDTSTHGWLVEINGIARIARLRGPARGCVHQTRPLMASVVPTLVTGSTFRLCDGTLSAVTGGAEP